MSKQKQPKIVSGSAATVAELGYDETWLAEWLAEDPTRLGLGALSTADEDPARDEHGSPAFLAADDDRYFSVDVRLGELDAEHGFRLLDAWARNRVRHPDRTHVAVLVTETSNERYRTTLETLTEHLPLVVIELQAWRGEGEAMLVSRIMLASEDLGFDPVTAADDAADASVETSPDGADDEVAADDDAISDDATPTDSADGAADAVTDDADGAEPASEAGADPETGVVDPWHLPKSEGETETPVGNGSSLLSQEMLDS